MGLPPKHPLGIFLIWGPDAGCFSKVIILDFALLIDLLLIGLLPDPQLLRKFFFASAFRVPPPTSDFLLTPVFLSPLSQSADGPPTWWPHWYGLSRIRDPYGFQAQHTPHSWLMRREMSRRLIMGQIKQDKASHTRAMGNFTSNSFCAGPPGPPLNRRLPSRKWEHKADKENRAPFFATGFKLMPGVFIASPPSFPPGKNQKKGTRAHDPNANFSAHPPRHKDVEVLSKIMCKTNCCTYSSFFPIH